MANIVTFTLNSSYLSTDADNFTIVGVHENGSPSDTTIATGVTKADLTTGVTYSIAETITGGTVTSDTVDCTNSVNWTVLQPTATPTVTPTTYSLSIYLNDAGSTRDTNATLFYTVNSGSPVNVPGATGTEFPGSCTFVYTITGLSNGDSVVFGTSMNAIITGNDDSTTCPPWSGTATTYTTTVNSTTDSVALTVDTFQLP